MKMYSDCGKRITALNSMNNVIFISQKDNPPLPNKLSGDLYGDRFEVLTKECGFRGNHQNSDPDDYTEDETSLLIRMFLTSKISISPRLQDPSDSILRMTASPTYKRD